MKGLGAKQIRTPMNRVAPVGATLVVARDGHGDSVDGTGQARPLRSATRIPGWELT